MAVFRPFGAGAAQGAVRGLAHTTGLVLAALAATAIAEALVATGAGTGNRLPAGADIRDGVAAFGTARHVAVDGTGNVSWFRCAAGPAAAELPGGTTAAGAATAIIPVDLVVG